MSSPPSDADEELVGDGDEHAAQVVSRDRVDLFAGEAVVDLDAALGAGGDAVAGAADRLPEQVVDGDCRSATLGPRVELVQ